MKKIITVSTCVEVDGENIAFMTCQIGRTLDLFSISIQVINEKLCKENMSLVEEKAKIFLSESFSEAVANGWTMLDINKSKLK